MSFFELPKNLRFNILREDQVFKIEYNYSLVDSLPSKKTEYAKPPKNRINLFIRFSINILLYSIS